MLEYKIIFDPLKTWPHRDMFEEDLASFFGKNGLGVTYIDMAESSKPHVRMLEVSRIDQLDTKESVKTPAQTKRLLTAKRTKDGKFEK